MAYLPLASTASFKKKVEDLQEGENPIYLGVLRLLVHLLPDALTPGNFMDKYDNALHLISEIERLENTNMNLVHHKVLLFVEEAFPQNFADRIAVLVVNRYLE